MHNPPLIFNRRLEDPWFLSADVKNLSAVLANATLLIIGGGPPPGSNPPAIPALAETQAIIRLVVLEKAHAIPPVSTSVEFRLVLAGEFAASLERSRGGPTISPPSGNSEWGAEFISQLDGVARIPILPKLKLLEQKILAQGINQVKTVRSSMKSWVRPRPGPPQGAPDGVSSKDVPCGGRGLLLHFFSKMYERKNPPWHAEHE